LRWPVAPRKAQPSPLALPRQPLVERGKVDHHALMGAAADLFGLVVRRHLEFDSLAMNLDDLGFGADLMADGGSGQMPDIDRGADRALARIEIWPDRVPPRGLIGRVTTKLTH